MQIKEKLFIFLTFIFIAVMGFNVYQKEALINNGATIYLRLAPFDPRSLMQGDYMRLRFELENDIPLGQDITEIQLNVNSQNIASVKTVSDEQPLNTNKVKLKIISGNKSRKGILPNSFMFQEGMAKKYEDARYAVVKHDGKGNATITHLADANLAIIF